jgi:hypothetical protein
MAEASHRAGELEALFEQRKRLLAEGADAPSLEASDKAWERGVARAEDELVLLCDAALESAVGRKLAGAGAGGRELSAVLADLAQIFEQVADLERRLSSLRKSPSALRARALGPRVGLLIEASFARLDALDRATFSREIDAILGVLERASLGGVVAPSSWLSFTAEALRRSEARLGSPAAPQPAPGGPGSLGYDGYRALRSSGPRVLSAFVLAEVALRVSPAIATSGATPAEGLSALASLLNQIPEPLRAEVLELDFMRLERAASYLEAWWRLLEDAGSRGAPLPLSPEERLRAIIKSGFFKVLLEESALVRFVLEAKLLADLFPSVSPRADALRARVDDLGERARQHVFDLFRRRSDAAWRSALGAASPEPGRALPSMGPQAAPNPGAQRTP